MAAKKKAPQKPAPEQKPPEQKPQPEPKAPHEDDDPTVVALLQDVFAIEQPGVPPQDSREPALMTKAALECAADLTAAHVLVAEVLSLDDDAAAPASLVAAFFSELGRRRRELRQTLRFADEQAGRN